MRRQLHNPVRFFLRLGIYIGLQSDNRPFLSSDLSTLMFLFTHVTKMPNRFPRKCTPARSKARQKIRFPTVTQTTYRARNTLLFIRGKLETSKIDCGDKIQMKRCLFTFSSGKQAMAANGSALLRYAMISSVQKLTQVIKSNTAVFLLFHSRIFFPPFSNMAV